MTPDTTLVVAHFDMGRGPVIRSHQFSNETVRRWCKVRGHHPGVRLRCEMLVNGSAKVSVETRVATLTSEVTYGRLPAIMLMFQKMITKLAGELP